MSQKIPLSQTLNTFAEKKINDAFQQSGQALPGSVVAVQGAIVTVKFEVHSKFTLPNVRMPLAGAEYIRYPIQKGDRGYCIPGAARLGGLSNLGAGTADLSQPANLAALVFFPFGNAKWSPVDSQAVVIYGPNGVVLEDTHKTSTFTLTPSGVVVHTPELTFDVITDVTINCGGDCSISAGGAATVEADSVAVTASGDCAITATDIIVTTETAEITASGAVTLEADTVLVTSADVTFDGNVTVTGTLDVAGLVTVGDDVVAASGVTLITHIHPGVQSGGAVTGPPTG